MATNLIDLIDTITADDLPTNEFTIEDKDPMVILGKLNEVIAYLQTLQATINASDSKANEALQKAIQAVADATQALSVANGIDVKATQALANAIEAVGTANTALSASNTALNTANTAISSANTALSSANSAVETADNALDTAESAKTKADTAITTANEAKTTAEGIDAKATTALANSQTAVGTANSANATAQEALSQVVAGQGTKVYRDTQLLTSLDIKPIEEDIASNTTSITALQNAKVDKVAGKQLSTEDFTTTEKTKLAGLSNYDDTQVKADISALQTRATNIETKNTEQDTAIGNINTKNTQQDSRLSTLETSVNTLSSTKQNNLTTEQLNATNSGITQSKVQNYEAMKQQYLKNASVNADGTKLTLTKQDNSTVVFGGSGWVKTNTTLSTSTSNTTVDLNTILPSTSGNEEYEILVQGYFENTSGTVGSRTRLRLYTDKIGSSSDPITIAEGLAQVRNVTYVATGNIIVSIHRYLYTKPETLDSATFKMYGYRRIK